VRDGGFGEELAWDFLAWVESHLPDWGQVGGFRIAVHAVVGG